MMIKPRIIRWVGHVARLVTCKSVLKTLTGKPVGKIPLWSNRRCEDNFGMDLQEIRCQYEWIS